MGVIARSVSLAALVTSPTAVSYGVSATSLAVGSHPYGEMPDGTPVRIYHLENANGMKAGILTYGGVVQRLTVPEKNEKAADVAGRFCRHWSAFSLEARHDPDSPSRPNFPSAQIKPGGKFTQTTIYKFLPE